MIKQERAALERLIEIAKADTGQSRRVADFLLAWWNAGNCGSFDLTTMWGCERAVVEDMAIVFRFVGHHNDYPGAYGYSEAFEQIMRNWRPELDQTHCQTH